ncbi:MAG: tocopherol cyclase family protein [Bacteroidales bacterium]|nr:tocopherol cyclase family protein [Bacteroidales bacterium]
MSFIPGISISKDGEQHAFIQIIDGKTAQTDYYSFPIEEFSFSRKEFAIAIGQNYFSRDKIILNIRNDTSFITGEIKMSEQVEFPTHAILNPEIMGWYRFVPFMECYHGVVSMTHQLEGQLLKNGKAYNFDRGIGYIEKDWGSSMPAAWIWIQSNNFNKGHSSFMLSVANIPWLGKSFTGFLGFFLHDKKLYRFATYTNAKLKIEKSESDTVRITIKNRKNTFSILAVRKNSGLLKAPVKGSMDRRIPESVDARLELSVYDKKGVLIFCDSTSVSGLEMVGDQKLLMKLVK